MLRNTSAVLIGLSVGAMVLLSGCGPSANLSLQFNPQSSSAYEVTTEVTKDFKFEQPTMDKLREEQTKTFIQMNFTQTVDAVDDKGIATATVTIDALKVTMTNKNEQKLAYDSAKPEDKTNPLTPLIGQRYTVQISPEGKVVSFDSAAAQKIVTAGFEAKLAERLLSEDGIRERHEIPALWGAGKGGATVKKTWTEVVPSPPGLLAPKTYQKTYTLTGVETRDGQQVAVVDMKATESAEPAKEQKSSAAGMGMFAKMFDSEDVYTGTLLLGLAGGDVMEYGETLVSTYTAQEMPENAAPDKGPDTLTMRFTNRISMKKLK